MEKSQVLLIQSQPLLGEGLQRIFQKVNDVELVCVPELGSHKMESLLKDIHPAMVLFAVEKEDDQTRRQFSKMLKRYEDIPIVWVELETNKLRLVTSHSLNATSAGLINAIREAVVKNTEVLPDEKKPEP